MIRLKTRRERLGAWFFILPALSIYVLFQIVPLILALGFSVMDWNGIAGSKLTLVYFDNFKRIFSNKYFLLSLKNMVRMVFFSVLFHTPVALILAVALNEKLRGYRFFKALYFVPTVFPLTSVGLMWYFIFMPTGALNMLLKTIGQIEWVAPWLVNPATAMNMIIFVNIWVGIGYYVIIILAGLTTIPPELYEAAAIDGAKGWHNFFYITIPNLKSILAMCIVMDIIGTVKLFDLVFAMTGGGPNGLTNLPTTLLYNEAFKYNHYGIGSAIGIVILVICLVLTMGSSRLLSWRGDEL